MNWKNRLTNYNFWISIFSAVLLILQALKIEFDVAYVNEIFTAVLGLLVVVGIIIDPTKNIAKTTAKNEKLETKNEQKKEESIPSIEESKNDISNIQDDFKTFLNKISSDLKVRMQELEEVNKHTTSMLAELQNEQMEAQNDEGKKDVEILPAVAEIDNPYLNL